MLYMIMEVTWQMSRCISFFFVVAFYPEVQMLELSAMYADC